MPTIFASFILAFALAADDPPKLFWQLDYERGSKALKRGQHVDVINYFTRAIPKAEKDKAARKTEVIAEMWHGVAVSYKALGEDETNVWSRKTKFTAADTAFRRARKCYEELRGIDDPIILEITHELAETREYAMLDSDKLASYRGQRPDENDDREGVWEGYLEVLAYKEKQLGLNDPEVIKYRKDIHRKLWTTIRRMRKLIKSCKYEEWIYNAEIELSELEKLADALKEKNKASQVPADQGTN